MAKNASARISSAGLSVLTSALLATLVCSACGSGSDNSGDDGSSNQLISGAADGNNGVKATASGNGNISGGALTTKGIQRGFLLRYLANPKLCLTSQSQQPAPGDQLLLQNCNNSNAQLFSYQQGSLRLGAQAGLHFPSLKSGSANQQAFVLGNFYDGYTFNLPSSTWRINSNADYVVAPPAKAAGAKLSLQHGLSSNKAASFVMDSYNENQNFSIFYVGDANYCMYANSTQAGMKPCDGNDNSQRWLFYTGTLVNGNAECLTMDANQTKIHSGNCNGEKGAPKPYLSFLNGDLVLSAKQSDPWGNASKYVAVDMSKFLIYPVSLKNQQNSGQFQQLAIGQVRDGLTSQPVNIATH